MTYYHLTHHDLDGFGCSVVAQNLNPQAGYRLQVVGYAGSKLPVDDAVDAIIDVLDKDVKPSLLITDIAPSEAVCARLEKHRDRFHELLVLDHHKTTQDLPKHFPWVQHATSSCGTMLTLTWFMHANRVPQSRTLEELCSFSYAVDAYDRWQLGSPHRRRGEGLNMLTKFMGDQEFVKRFAERPDYDFSEIGRAVLGFLQAQRDRLIDSVLLSTNSSRFRYDPAGHCFTFLLLSEYGNEIADKLLNLYPELDYVAFGAPFGGGMSLRAREGGELDVSAIAQRHDPKGGGHATSAGFPFDFLRAIREAAIDKLSK